jgi:hypothetical protein
METIVQQIIGARRVTRGGHSPLNDGVGKQNMIEQNSKTRWTARAAGLSIALAAFALIWLEIIWKILSPTHTLIQTTLARFILIACHPLVTVLVATTLLTTILIAQRYAHSDVHRFITQLICLSLFLLFFSVIMVIGQIPIFRMGEVISDRNKTEVSQPSVGCDAETRAHQH